MSTAMRVAAVLLLLLAVAPPSHARGAERDVSAVEAAPRERGATRPRKPKKPAMTGVLNVNRATEAELKLLPGIGRGRAHAIVERRNKRPFSSLEELSRMKGMKGVVRRLRSHLTVDGETTLRPAGG